MRVNETLLDGDPERYEQRYVVMIATAPQYMVRRPVSIEPPEGTICFVDNGPRFGSIPRMGAATFKDGRWRKVKFEPTHWTYWEDKAVADGA